MERCNYCNSIIRIKNLDEFLEPIKKIIEADGLAENCRLSSRNHKRYYLYNIMRQKGITLEEIGRYFNRKHSSVLHGLMKHNLFTELNDKKYLNDVKDYDNLFQVDKGDVNTVLR